MFYTISSDVTTIMPVSTTTAASSTKLTTSSDLYMTSKLSEGFSINTLFVAILVFYIGSKDMRCYRFKNTVSLLLGFDQLFN